VKQQIQFSFTEISELLFPILEENIVLGDALLYIPVDEGLWNNKIVDLEEKIDRIAHCEDSNHLLQRFLQYFFPKLLKQNFEGFSMIIGNPPYISSKDLPMEYKELLRVLYETAVHQFDVYSIFIELSHGILSPKGYFCFIIPESYLGRSSFTESRWLLLNCTQILKIENIQNVFQEKSISNIILYFQNGEKQGNSFDFIFYDDKQDFKFKKGSSISIPQNYCYKIQNFKILPHPKEIRKIIDKIHSNTIPLISYIKIHRGEEIGKRSDLIINKRGRNTLKILSGENIKNFHIESKNKFILEKNIKKENAFYYQPKILVRQLGNRIQAAYDEKGEFVTLQTVYNIMPSSKSISNEFLLALFNSNLIQFYYEVIFREKQIFPRILLENILNFPLVVPEQQQHENLRVLVKNISNSFKTDKISHEFVSKLNEEIYTLYGLDDREKEIIENHLKTN
jgi:hypothetical protein